MVKESSVALRFTLTPAGPDSAQGATLELLINQRESYNAIFQNYNQTHLSPRTSAEQRDLLKALIRNNLRAGYRYQYVEHFSSGTFC